MSPRARLAAILLALLVATAAAAWRAAPRALEPLALETALPADLALYLAGRERLESERYGLVPDTGKRIRWFADAAPTRYAVVYLHGFSASRQETAPLAERVADDLGANLFETRLAGHGRIEAALEGVSAEDWLADAAEALAIGGRLGDELVVIGVSTGATLSLAMSGHPGMRKVATLVLVSPNFGPRRKASEWLTRPGGPQLAGLLGGKTLTWEPHNDLHRRYWSTSYPIGAAVEMMRLVKLARRLPPLEIGPDLLVLYSAEDRVVSPQAALAAVAEIDAPRKLVLEIDTARDPDRHVLAGRVLSPDSTEGVVAAIVDFVQAERK